MAADAIEDHAIPAVRAGGWPVRRYLRKLFYQPLHARSALAAGRVRAVALPPHPGSFHRDYHPAAHAGNTFFSLDRLLYLGGGKYRYLFWRMAVSAPEAAMGHRRANQ